MSDISIVRMESGSDRFWETIGPFCASKEIQGEIGTAITVEDRDVWVVAMDGDEPVSFGALRVGRKGGKVVHVYTAPSHRNRGLCGIVMDDLLKIAEERKMIAVYVVASPMAFGSCERRGFVLCGERGKFRMMRKEFRNDVEDDAETDD